MSLFVWGVLITLVVGVIAKLVLDNTTGGSVGGRNVPSISWPEFALGALIIAPLLSLAISSVGGHLAVASSVGGYKEYYNGIEVDTTKSITQCERNGSCDYHYSCDPYQQMHTRTVTDSKGNTSTETYYTTEYNSCPYSDYEISYGIETTINDYGLGTFLPDNPNEHRWQNNHSDREDGYVSEEHENLTRYPHGAPALWTAAKARIDSGNPGPVTGVFEYPNFLLAAQSNILNQHSDDIETYVKAKLLVNPTSGVFSTYFANKVYPIGVSIDKKAWNGAAMKFNGALGSELQGDLHTVIVADAKVSKSESGDYADALVAYWQRPELKKKQISKNAIVVVLGTDGTNITWVQSRTSMPTGNEHTMTDVENALTGQPLSPAIYGTPTAKLVTYQKGKKTKTKGVFTHTGAPLENALYGKNKYLRVCMTGCPENPGFKYLQSEIKPTSGQTWGINIFAGFIALLMWAGFAKLDDAYADSLFSHFRKGESKL